MKTLLRLLTTGLFALALLQGWAQDVPQLQTMYRVKYVADGTIYLIGGRSAGLTEGMKLIVKRTGSIVPSTGSGEMSASYIVAELTVASVADNSAVCDITKTNREIHVGDVAYLRQEDIEAVVQQRALSNTRKYPMIVSFTDGDPLDEEVRAEVPRPPLAEINRARGRIGVDYSAMNNHSGGGSQYSQMGLVARADITRIGGTYWNLSGYWRGRFNSTSSASQPQTVQDVINRTYHLELTYANPNSRWAMGVGRLYLPWASSLDTIDGGYLARRVGGHTTVGMFAGSTPDPSSWNYNPNREMAGTFVAFEGGSFDDFKYNSSFGVGVSALSYHMDKPFVFAENSLFYKHVLSIYDTMQADQPLSSDGTTRLDPGISRSYVTVRIQPTAHVAFDINHNYFRDVPTYDPSLVATGLVDKLLFQGISAGVRVELPEHVSLYTNIGRSSRTGDAKNSWNALYGVTLGRIWRTGIRMDARYSKFDSAFGQGWYESISLSRNFTERMRWELQGGRQSFTSPYTTDNGSTFVNSLLDVNVGSNYFMEGGVTFQRGLSQDYEQWFTTFGYRFDNRGRKSR
jgi:hypothetical protein